MTRLKVRKFKFVCGIAVMCIVCFFSCGKKDAPREPDVLNVKTVQSKNALYQDDLASFGTISFKSKNDVTALVEGTALHFYAKENDFVRKGTVLAKLKNIQLELQKEAALNSLESAKSSLNLARTKLWQERLSLENRFLTIGKSDIKIEQQELEISKAEIDMRKNKELLEIGGITEDSYKSGEISYKSMLADLEIMKKERESNRLGFKKEDLIANGIKPSAGEAEFKEQIIELNLRGIKAEIEAAESNIKNAENNLASINMMLSELTIYSPVNGVIGTRYYENGEYIKQNEKIFTIIDIKEVYAVFPIQEKDISGISLGTPLQIEIVSLRRSVGTAVEDISVIADAQSGNFQLKALVTNNHDDIRPGMFVRCVIPRGNDTRFITLPESVLVEQTQDKGTVFCVVNNIAVQKEVGIFSRKDGFIWINGGLEEGETIIDSPSPFLKEGAYVKAI